MVLCFALAACGGPVVCPPPAITAKVITQKVIVTVPCVNRSDIAAEPPHVSSQLDQKSGHDLLIVDGSALALRTWGEGMYAQLLGCSTTGSLPVK